MKIRRPVVLLATVALLAPTLAVASTGGPGPTGPTTFSFAATGDFGANGNTSRALKAMAGAHPDLAFALGDLSYSQVTPESAWCNYVKSRLGATFPFEIVAGNHEANAPNDGRLARFAACLPHRLGPLTGTYGQQYFFDYPTTAPLARFIMISPNLAFPGEGTYSYNAGGTRARWLADAIDSARARGIPWVVVGMHEVCLTAGTMTCQIGTDLVNLLVAKKVDLVLQGHEHGYQRSKQLALDAGCTAVPDDSSNPACVAADGASGAYTKGAGTLILIDGTGGEGFTPVNPHSGTAADFAKVMDSATNATFGFTHYTMTPTQLSAHFVRSGGSGFSDSFTITDPAADQPPTADTLSATTTKNTAVGLTLQGHDTQTCELTFTVVTGPAHGGLSPIANQPCTPGSPNRDRAGVTYTPAAGFTGTDSFTYQVADGAATSGPATVKLTVHPTGNQHR